MSREFSKSGTIHVNMYKEIEQSTQDTYDMTVTEKWNQDFRSVSWLKMPKHDLEALSTSLNAQRNRSVAGMSGRPSIGRNDPSAAYDYGALDHAEMQDPDMPGLLYHSTLEPEVFQWLNLTCLSVQHAEGRQE